MTAVQTAKARPTAHGLGNDGSSGAVGQRCVPGESESRWEEEGGSKKNLLRGKREQVEVGAEGCQKKWSRVERE